MRIVRGSAGAVNGRSYLEVRSVEWAPDLMTSHRWRGWRPVFLSAALALVTTGVSMNAGGRLEHRGETIALQQAILRAEPGGIGQSAAHRGRS